MSVEQTTNDIQGSQEFMSDTGKQAEIGGKITTPISGVSSGEVVIRDAGTVKGHLTEPGNDTTKQTFTFSKGAESGEKNLLSRPARDYSRREGGSSADHKGQKGDHSNKTRASTAVSLAVAASLSLAGCTAAEMGITTPSQQQASAEALEPGAQRLANDIITLFGDSAGQTGYQEAEILVNFGWNSDSTQRGLPTFGSVDLTVFEPTPGSLKGAVVEEIDTRLIHDDVLDGTSTERDIGITDPGRTTEAGGPTNSWAATELNLLNGSENASNPGISTTPDNPSYFSLPIQSLSAAPKILADATADIQALDKAIKEGN